jgi:hypothetical protein
MFSLSGEGGKSVGFSAGEKREHLRERHVGSSWDNNKTLHEE